MSRRSRRAAAAEIESRIDRLGEKMNALKDMLDRYDAGVERLLGEHKPYPAEFDIRPGNSHPKVTFYCTRCRTPWPCRTFNELRALYGEAHEWEPATMPYEPLVLKRADA